MYNRLRKSSHRLSRHWCNGAARLARREQWEIAFTSAANAETHFKFPNPLRLVPMCIVSTEWHAHPGPDRSEMITTTEAGSAPTARWKTPPNFCTTKHARALLNSLESHRSSSDHEHRDKLLQSKRDSKAEPAWAEEPRPPPSKQGLCMAKKSKTSYRKPDNLQSTTPELLYLRSMSCFVSFSIQGPGASSRSPRPDSATNHTDK